MPTTKVQTTRSTVTDRDGNEYETTQFRTTIPKELAEALDLEDAELEWKVDSGSALKVIKK